MKKTLALLLIPAALLVGLLLPRLTVQMEDRYMYRESLSGIEQVDLNTSSGLVTVEKIAMLSASDVSLLYVGVGQHQTAATLSAACWRLLDVVQNNYGVQLLDTDTAEQSQQTAILASRDLTAFLFWEVLFQDADGNELRIYLDDEEALPLAMSYHNGTSGKEGRDLATWTEMVVYGFCDTDGIGLEWTEDPETYEEPTDSGSYQRIYPVTDGDNYAKLELRGGEGWFTLNAGKLA